MASLVRTRSTSTTPTSSMKCWSLNRKMSSTAASAMLSFSRTSTPLTTKLLWTRISRQRWQMTTWLRTTTTRLRRKKKFLTIVTSAQWSTRTGQARQLLIFYLLFPTFHQQGDIQFEFSVLTGKQLTASQNLIHFEKFHGTAQVWGLEVVFLFSTENGKFQFYISPYIITRSII